MENQNNSTPVVQNNQEVAKNQNAEKEIQANQQANNLEFGEEIRKMLPTAGTLELTEEQKNSLYEPIKDSDVYIKPDGLVYLSWIKYSGRLTKAFTGTGWAMLPQGMPKAQNNLVIWGFHLVIKGVYCGFAIGEQQFFENGRMTFGEACEGAKSNALMRLCKGLGIGLELWDKEFIEKWLATYANKKWDDEKRKYLWSLKPNAFGTATTTPIVQPTQQVQPMRPPTPTPAPVQETIKVEIVKGKVKDNADFLNQTEKPVVKKIKKSTDDIPVIPMDDSEIDNGNKDIFTDLINGSTGPDDLTAKYGEARIAFEKGEISAERKEQLRDLANAKYKTFNKKAY
jgi:hypothetical protein